MLKKENLHRIAWLMAAVFCAGAAGAAEVKIFRGDTREAVLEGELEGISVDPLGALELAPRLERLAAVEEPFVFTAAGHPEGWVLGTGNSGKTLLVDGEGEIRELAALAEPEVFAVLAEEDGTVWVGTSPRGKVYRLADGEVEEVWSPGEAYIWALARDGEGGLLVATGLEGRLYRLQHPERRPAEAEVLLEGRDRHLRALQVLADGSVLVGTAGQGLILRRAEDGTVTTVHDAVQPEILAFAAAPDGTVYAAALASEASQVDLSGQQRPAANSGAGGGKNGKAEGEGEGQATVVVSAQGEMTVGSRSAGFSGPRSVVFAISPDGRVEELFELADETVHSLLWQGGELWVGSGQEGRLYRYQDRRLIQERELEEQQLMALAKGGAGVAVVTTNGAAVYRLGDGREEAGTFTSGVLDAEQVARFGSFRWRGSLPRGTEVELAFRSGMSAEPDDTWSAWGCGGCASADVCRDGEADCPVSGRRQEVALADLAHGRYVQWRSTLRGGEATPRLEVAELTYRQQNLRPKVAELQVLSPGKILVPQSFNPSSQTFEPWSPNREGIFTTLKSAAANGSEGRLKSLWKKGYRTLRWKVEDGNEDELHYRLDFRPADGPRQDPDEGWIEVVSELEEAYYSFDATVLPDGVYRFRLRASDRPSQMPAEALAGEKLSQPVTIDHTPPVLVSRRQRDGAVEAEVGDELSPLRDAVVSIDGGEWQPVAAADGLLDSRREAIRVAVPEEARMVLLRLTDAHHNVITYDLLAERARQASPLR